MFYIGCHLSAAKGYLAMGKEAVKLGANVFQFFTRNPRGGSVKALDLEDIEKYNAFHAEHRFGTLLAHAPYTMNPCAGKGSEVGRSFEELRAILDRVEQKERMGVCLDTCHVYDGGYDIIGDLDGVLQVFDDIIGLDRLKAIHLNDSKNPIGSHKDRHEKIGEGTLGLAGIANIINHPKLCHLPFYLETPNEAAGYAKEISLLKSLREEK